jgi:hypothetical protein
VISLSYSDLISVTGIALAFLSLLVSLLIAFGIRRKGKYDQTEHRIELELMRRSIEGQMYGLNDKLVATEGRWRDVNHLVIAAQDRNISDNSRDNFPSFSPLLRAAGISEADAATKEDFVFVITPFHPKYREQFDTIASTCRDLGLTARRGDEDFIEGDVFPHILRLIVKSRFIIANIDGRNANVFYELGIAQALGKPTILVSSTPEQVPFDIRTKRLVLFNSMAELGVMFQ